MTSLLPQYYDILKSAVLATTGFTTITPCDCKVISAKIFNLTKQNVSETTIKRIYGFAYSKFNPSLFTINVLAKYCGYNSWEHFCLVQEESVVKGKSSSANWQALKLSASKITTFTLKVLRNKSGIPYSQTIKRQFIDHHFNSFLNSDHTATIISAPAGYGKTIALCHWIEERLMLNAEGQTNDTILFLSTNALMNAFLSGRDLNQWLLALLGYSLDNDISILFDNQQEKGGNFLLIFDDLDEYAYKPEQFKLLLNQLLDIFSLFQSAAWFKMILTMRAATWINNRHEIEGSNNKWFKGFIGDENWATNVPLYTSQEINELCLKINPAIKEFLAVDLADNFNHPLYFQFYYKENKDNFSLNEVDHICIYDLISTFILNKIYLGQNSAEKVLFLKGLAEHMNLATRQYDVPKIKVNNLIKQYSNAYQELISIGFLRELNISSNLQYETFIQFTNHNFLEYTLSRHLLNENNYVFNKEFIDDINVCFEGNPHKLSVLKWCVIYAIRTGQQKSFDLLAHAKLTFAEKSNLIIFLGDLLQKECMSAGKSESLVQFFKQDCSTTLFNSFFGLEFINSRYNKTLLTLLNFNLSTRKRILIHTALGISAIKRLDVKELEINIVKLKTFPAEHYHKFAINPLNCLETILGYLKYGTVKKDVFNELTRFYFNPPVDGNYFEDSISNDMIYLLSVNTLLLFNKPIKILRFINVLDKHYKKTELKINYSYSYFINIVLADSYCNFNRIDELLKIYKPIEKAYKQCPDTFTPYMKTVFYSLRIKLNIRLDKYKFIVEDMRSFMQISEQYGLAQLLMLGTIISLPQIANSYPQLYKECEFKYDRLRREIGLNKDAFSQHVLLQ